MSGSETSCVLLMMITLVLFSFLLSEAKDIVIGGKTDAWKVPSSESDSLNKWAESSRFRIGDSLVWKYDSQKESVLEVSKEAYLNCNVSNPVEEYRDGNTKVKLERAGPYYFISGAEGHCIKGQKMIVVVLSPRHNNNNNNNSPAPSPSPSEFDFEEGPAVAPSPTSTATRFNFKGSLIDGGLVSLGIFLSALI